MAGNTEPRSGGIPVATGFRACCSTDESVETVESVEAKKLPSLLHRKEGNFSLPVACPPSKPTAKKKMPPKPRLPET